MRTGRVRAVLLDMGGVLIPEVTDYRRAGRDPVFRRHLAALGVSDPERAVLEASTRLRAAYRAAEPECTQPDPDVVLGDLDPGVRRLLLAAFRHEAAPPPFGHVRAVVARLARRYRLGLVSNTVIPGSHHARNLARHGILQHIGSAVWSASFGRRKPDPAMIRAVLGELRVPPHRAIFVGDKLRTDVRAARAAGVRAVHLDRNGARPGEGPRPDFVIRDLRELPRLLATLG